MMKSILRLIAVRPPLVLLSFHRQRFLVYRPNLKAKSDADILRDAKLEAMGMPPQDDSARGPSNQEKTQMATDEIVRVILSL